MPLRTAAHVQDVGSDDRPICNVYSAVWQHRHFLFPSARIFGPYLLPLAASLRHFEHILSEIPKT